MAKKKKKPSDQVRYGAQPFQVGSINDVVVQEAIAGPDAQSSRAYASPEYVPPSPADAFEANRDYSVDEYQEATGADRGVIGEFLGAEGPTGRPRKPVFSDSTPGARSTTTVLTDSDREKLSDEAITAQNLADAEARPQGNDPLKPEYYPAERTRPDVAGLSRADALRMLPMDLADDWDAAQDFSYDNYPNLMRAAQQSSLSMNETRDLVNITLAVDTARMIQSSVDPMRRKQLLQSMNPQQQALVIDIIGAMEQEVMEKAASFPMNEPAPGDAPGQVTQSTTQQSQQNPIAQFVSDAFVTPSFDIPGSFADSIDYGPFKDGKFYYGGTGAWNTLVDVGETGLQSTRAAMLRGNTGDGSWSDAWNAASMGTFDPTMVAAIKENHDPLMVDVAIAWKKTAHSGEPDRFAAVLEEFEGNSAAMRHIDGFINPEPGSEYELVSNALDVSETGNLAVLAAWAGAQGASDMTLSSTPIAGMLYEAAGLKKDASNYEDIVAMAENEVGRSLMKLGNFGSVFLTDPFLVTGVVGKGVRGAKYGLYRMSDEGWGNVWESRAVRRYWDRLGSQFDEVRAMSNEADKATRLNSIAAQNKNWFKDREAIYTMYNMGVKDSKTAREFIESGDNVELLLRGQAAKRKSSRYVPHQHAATAIFKASMMYSRRALQGQSAAKQIDMVFGEGTSARLPSEALPGILRVLEQDPANAGRLLNDFVYVDGEGVRTFMGRWIDVVKGTPRAAESSQSLPGLPQPYIARAAARLRGIDNSSEAVAAEKSRGVIDPDNPSKSDVRKQRFGWRRQKGKLWTRLGRLGARQAFRKPISVRDGRDAGEIKKLVQGYGMSTQFANYMEYLWRSDALSVAERHQLAQGLNRTAIYSSGLDLVAPALARSMEDTITTIADRAGTKYAPDQLDVVSIRARAENQVRQLNNERREANMREFTAQEAADQLQRSVDQITAMEIKRLDDARDAARRSAQEFEARLASAPDEGMPATPQDLIPESPDITKAQAIAVSKYVQTNDIESWNAYARSEGTKSHEKLGRIFWGIDEEQYIRAGIVPDETGKVSDLGELDTVEVVLPPVYWGDARSRLDTLRLVEDEDLIVKETKKGTTVRLTADQYDDIVGDLDHYLDPDIMEDMAMGAGFYSSFRAAQKRMAAIERPKAAADEAATPNGYLPDRPDLPDVPQETVIKDLTPIVPDDLIKNEGSFKTFGFQEEQGDLIYTVEILGTGADRPSISVSVYRKKKNDPWEKDYGSAGYSAPGTAMPDARVLWTPEGWRSAGRVNRDNPPEESKMKLVMDYAEGLQERFNLGPFSLADEAAEAAPRAADEAAPATQESVQQRIAEIDKIVREWEYAFGVFPVPDEELAEFRQLMLLARRAEASSDYAKASEQLREAEQLLARKLIIGDGSVDETGIPMQGVRDAQTGVPFRGDFIRGEGGIGRDGEKLSGTGDEAIAGDAVYLTDNSDMAQDFARDYSDEFRRDPETGDPLALTEDTTPVVGDVVTQEVVIYNPFVIRGQDEWNAFTSMLGLPGKPGRRDVAEMQAGIRGYLIANGHDGMIVDMGDAVRGSGNSIDDTFMGNNIIKLKGPDVPDLAPKAAADEAAPVADDLPPVEIPTRTTEQIDDYVTGMGPGMTRDRLRENFPDYRGPQQKPVIRYTPMKEGAKPQGPKEGAEFEVMPSRDLNMDDFDPKTEAWAVVHVPHGGYVNVGSARGARELAENPGEFCGACQAVEEGIRQGYIVNDGGMLVFADEALGRTVPESPYESLKDARASVGDQDGVYQAIRDDINSAMDVDGLGNPSALDDTSNYALYQYQLANNVRMLDPSRLDAFAARASYLNALLGTGPKITTAVDVWTLGTLAGPRFVMRSGAEDWALFALTGGSIFGKNSWWSNRRRSRAIREATNDDPLESKKGPASKNNKGKKVSVATTLARDVAAVPFLRSIMTRWLSEDELEWAARQATEKGFDEGKREGLAWLVGTAMARSRYWSLGNRKAYKAYRDELDELAAERDALEAKKALARSNGNEAQADAIQGSINAKNAEIEARIDQGIDGVKTQEADDIIANGVRFGYLNHSMDAASESGSSLASGTRPHRPADDVQSEKANLSDPGLEFGLTTPGGGSVRREVFSGSETKIRFDDKWKPEDIDDLYQELNGVLHMDDQLAYLALARSRQYYALRRAVAQGKEGAREDLDAFLREIVDMVDDEGNRVFDLSGFVLAADGNLGEQGFVDRVFSDVLRLVTTADGSYNNKLVDGLLLPNWVRVQVSDELALSLGFKPRGKNNGTYITIDQEMWDDAIKRADEDDRIMLEAAGRPILIQNSSGGVSKRKFGLRYVDAEGKTKLNLDQTALAAMDELPQTVGHQNFIPIIATNEIPTTTKLWNMMGRALARLTREPIYLTNYVDSVKMLKGSDWFEATVKMHEDAMRGRQAALGDDALESGVDIPTEARARAERDAHEKAADMAYDLTMAYVDNPEIRSQLAWQVRNIARFYRALEDFYRRMLRTTQNDPMALLKGAIAFKAFDESGFTWEDEYGERYFIFPGTQAMFSAYNQMMAAFGLDQRMPTLPVAFGARLSMVMPSTDPNAAIPMLGSPWASITLKSAIRVAPTLATVTGRSRSQAEEMSDALEGMLFGEYAPQQSMFNSLINDTIGPNIKRVIDAGLATAMPDSRLSQSETGFASTAKQALHIVLSELYDPTKQFESKSAKDAYLDEMMAAVDTTALNIMIWKALTTPLLIATPQVTGTGVSDMAREIGITGYDTVWLTYLNKYPNDYEKAMIEFTKNHPGKAIFTTSKYEGTAFYESTLETEEFIKNNRNYFDENPVGLSYFAPQNGVYGGLSTFYFMRANGIKYPKSVEAMLKQSLSAEGDNLMRVTQAQYDEFRANATSTEELKQIKKDEQAAKKEIKAMYPFADLDDTFELDDTKKKATAEQIDVAARYMIESGQDESGMAEKTREVYSRYKFMLDRKAELNDRNASKQINSDWSRYVENELMSLYPGNEQWIRILQVLTRNINAQSGTLDLLRIEEGAA